MEWALIIFLYVGPWGDTDSVTVTSIPVATEQLCEAAAKKLPDLVSGTKKEVEYVCVRTK